MALMRMSSSFGKTLREAPADAELPSHALMVRAGMMKKLASGIYSYMPLLYRTMRKIETIIREEMNAIDGQEVNMPVVHSADIWQESGRYYADIPEMVRFQDRGGRDMVLGMTHEEVITDLVRGEIESYRQLPLMLYQIQTKFRDEPRSRGGLIRVREFVMKDAYSFHTSNADLDKYYDRVAQAYHNIYQRSGLNAISVESDTGMMGGSGAHEFMYVTDVGEDTLVLCPHCGYAANTEVAQKKKHSVNEIGDLLDIEQVSTLNKKEISEVASFLDVTADKTIKTMIYVSKNDIVLVAVRGDVKINERKLAKALADEDFRLAEASEVVDAGLVAGYVSPVGLEGFKIVVDDSLQRSRNLIAGANKEGFHLKNVNYKRDFTADLVADLAEVEAGDTCINCNDQVQLVRGVEVGNIFKLGTKYSDSMGATYLDDDGQEKPIIMGCYGIGVGRLAACVVEQSHDEDGIIWPMNIAPYHVIIVPIGRDSEIGEKAFEMAQSLSALGIDVMLDDRDLRPGVKFKDADLIGFPIRVVLSSRSIKQQAAEVKLRDEKEAQLIPLDKVQSWLLETVSASTDI